MNAPIKTYEQLMQHYWGVIVPMALAEGINPWEKPELGTIYWVVDPSYPELVCHREWHFSCGDFNLLKLGLCHTTKEAAIAHAKTLFSFTEIKE